MYEYQTSRPLRQSASPGTERHGDTGMLLEEAKDGQLNCRSLTYATEARVKEVEVR